MNARLLFSLGLAAATWSAAHADQIVFNFSVSNAPLFDLSVSFETNVDNMYENFTATVSPRGRISGPFTASFDDGTMHLDFNGAMGGFVLASAQDFRMSMTAHTHFSGTAFGRDVHGTQTTRQTLRVDATGENFVGRQVITTCMAGHGCRTTVNAIREPVPNTASTNRGEWTLVLELVNGPRQRISGTAAATLSSGAAANFKVTGSASTAKQITTLRLLGTGDAAGVSLQLKMTAANELLALRGRLYGQRIDYMSQP